jgi:NADP-dependent 3-hydroxy acid dehydrogenase YdfG
MLESKCAVVFGAGGSVGAAVAKEFAAEGARVFLAGRTKPSLEAVAERISAAAGEAQTTVVDALDDTAVNRSKRLTIRGTGRAGRQRAAEHG